MDVSIGIMAHNEEKNIGRLLKTLLGQDLSFVKEIIIVDDGSTDETAHIVKKFLKNKKIRLVTIKERSGKINAINVFLGKAKSEIVVIESADTLPEKDAIRLLADEFKKSGVGIVGARAIPTNNGKKFADFFGRFVYEMHHEISLKSPKFGEFIAFRKVIRMVPDTLVDEEQIAMMIRERDYKLKYCPRAIFYNKQPEKISEIISRRKRYAMGHMDLSKKGYEVPTYKIGSVARALVKCSKMRFLRLIILSVMLEAYIRLAAYFAFQSGKTGYPWSVAESTKSLRFPEDIAKRNPQAERNIL